jgi:hypothetical protein
MSNFSDDKDDLTDFNFMVLQTCERHLVTGNAKESRAKFKILKQL